MHRAIGDVQIVVAVDSAVAIHHGCLRVVAHTAGAGLVLPATDPQTWRLAPDLGRARGAQPFVRARLHEAGRAYRLGVAGAREPCHRDAPAVVHSWVEHYASVGAGDLLHWAGHADHASEVFAHPLLVRQAPARQVGWQIARPEDDWQHNELIREHRAADHASIAMVE